MIVANGNSQEMQEGKLHVFELVPKGDLLRQKERETQASGQGWELFKNYLIAKEKFKPDFFLYENNNSISKQIKACITNALGVENQTINSALVSAQERKREYWHNGEKSMPENADIKLQDIIVSGIAEREKA